MLCYTYNILCNLDLLDNKKASLNNLEKTRALILSADVVHDLIEKQQQIINAKEDGVDEAAKRHTEKIELECLKADRQTTRT